MKITFIFFFHFDHYTNHTSFIQILFTKNKNKKQEEKRKTYFKNVYLIY